MSGRKSTPMSILDDVLSAQPSAVAEPTLIALSDIVRNGGTQMRATLDPDTITEYAAAMASGWGTFPPVVLFYDGALYHLGDGFHRTEAAARVGIADIPADVRSGTRRDAVLHAAGANASHGLRRTNADKRRSVMTLLEDVEWRSWSDNEISRRCNVSPTFVGTLRASLSTVDSEEPEERTYTTRHGTQATMKTEKIGKSRPAPTVLNGGRASTSGVEYPPVWELESHVRIKVTQYYKTDETTDAIRDMREAARERSGMFWHFATVSLALYRQHDLVQAINNVANQMEVGQDAQRKVAASAPRPAQSLSTVDSETPRMPADLESLGWQLRQLDGMGRWYAHNPGQHKATSPVDNWRDAVAAARDMQRNVLPPADVAAAEQAFGPDVQAQPEPLAATLASVATTNAPTWWTEEDAYQAERLLQKIADNWPGTEQVNVSLILVPTRHQDGSRIFLSTRAESTPRGSWHTTGMSLAEAIINAESGRFGR
jgi:hypothetical protein